MELGLKRSSFGVVIVTSNLFEKKWAVEELDALMGMETMTTTRLIPLWVGVGASEVRSKSPMLAMRSAVIVDTIHQADLDQAAEQVASAIIELSWDRSLGQWLRAQVAGGLRWTAGPSFLPASLEHVSADERYVSTSFARHPASQESHTAGVVRPLRDFLENPTAWDGIEITAIGRQLPGTLQVLAEHDVNLGEHAGSPVVLGSYVFQLHSVDFDGLHTTYVNLHGPCGSGLRPDVGPNWVVWVTGVIIAYGSVVTHSGGGANCIYIAARNVYGMPPAATNTTAEPKPQSLAQRLLRRR